jgi:hypothetical protein
VVDLVTELSRKPRWDVPLALRFLLEKYEPKYKARRFSEYLTGKNRTGFKEVLDAATRYP